MMIQGNFVNGNVDVGLLDGHEKVGEAQEDQGDDQGGWIKGTQSIESLDGRVHRDMISKLALEAWI